MGMCRTCSQGCMWKLDHTQESSQPCHGYAPGHHLPTDGCWWWHLFGLHPAQLPHSPCCSLLYSGTEAFDFPFLAFLSVPEGVKQCLGHFPSSAATTAGSESCSMEGHQLLWGMICFPHCSLPGSAPPRLQVQGARVHFPLQCLPGHAPSVGLGACHASAYSV